MFWSKTLYLASSTEWHEHDIIEVVFCFSGAGHLLVGSADIELRKCRAIIVAPGYRHRFLLGNGESAEVKIVCLRRDEASLNLSVDQNAVLARANTTGGFLIDYQEREGWVWELVRRIPDTFGAESDGEARLAWGVVGLLVAAADRRIDSGGGRYAERDRKMQEVCTWIETNLCQPERLDVLAAKFGLSRSLLTREFRRHTGMSIVEYVNARRLQRAGAMLMSSCKTILEVSLEFGFASLPNFYAQFKAFYGVTPAEFRIQMGSDATSR